MPHISFMVKGKNHLSLFSQSPFMNLFTILLRGREAHAPLETLIYTRKLRFSRGASPR
jgi:hypothetical protein